MKFSLAVFALITLAITAQAQQTATTADGRKIPPNSADAKKRPSRSKPTSSLSAL
jgi:hypothetical protein